ncbi:hypothetical protein ACWGEA_16155 [Streptomyces zaomyceticus]
MKHLRTDQAVLVVYETGDVKKGTDTVGAQRQHTGTSGPRPPTAAGPPGLVTRPNSRPNRSLPPVWSPDAWTPPPGRLARGRRGPRRQPDATRRAGRTRHRLRPRGGLVARSHHRRREVPKANASTTGPSSTSPTWSIRGCLLDRVSPLGGRRQWPNAGPLNGVVGPGKCVERGVDL